MKKIALLGSTGSIGTQTLDIIRANSDTLCVHSLVAYSNEKIYAQASEFSPEYCALINKDGIDCLTEAVKGADIAVVATSGISAIGSVLYCLDNGIDVALANKEALVCAGELIMSKVGKAKLYPIDSEHCAISRCLAGHDRKTIDKILLTASGGPFRDLPKKQLGNVNAQQALNHPNWRMGAKITIDSATMMNKALEVIEASFLFGVPAEDVEILIHRQSIVHSMVRYSNGEIIAQLASPDMRLPIQLALLGEGGNYSCDSPDFARLLDLSFEKCDFDKFPCARLGYQIFEYPAICRTVMNAANDVCVERFLQGKFSFAQFYNIIIAAVDHFCNKARNAELTSRNIFEFDAATKSYVNELIDGEQC